MTAGDGHLASAVQGLSSTEVETLRARHGPNTVAAVPQAPVWARVLAQLRDPLILVLVAAAVLTVAVGDFADAIVISLVIVVNTAVGVAQEIKADHAVSALAELSAPTARVIRDGEVQEVAAAELVPTDVVHLAEGDVVPADAQLVDGPGVLVDESALTGESVPVERAPRADDLVQAGTVVVRGRAVAVITATGAESALGRIASLLDSRAGATPLQRRLAQLGRVLAAAAIVLCAVVLVIGLVNGQSLELMLVTAVSLAVAAVPESLPAVVTLGLALGARRMAERRAIVRRLAAVETLGSVTVIATDKTGTLTEGRMVVERLWTPDGDAQVTGAGYEPEGTITIDDEHVGPGQRPDLDQLLTAAVLANDARLVAPTSAGESSGRWEALGDPTEAALLAAGAKLGLHRDELEREFPRVAEVPFDSSRKRMTTLHRDGAAGLRIFAKGAPDVLLDPRVLTDPAPLMARAGEQARALGQEGYRVLAVAAGRCDSQPDDLAEAERGLTLLGLVAILDPPRASAADSIAACRDAGIASVLITGDHPDTARSIATRLGILDGATDTSPSAGTDPQIVVGTDLDLDGHDVRAVRVYARTTPEQKLDIIDAWRATGAVVAMTGDGVNDGPALRRADIGVAMGQRGTEVARQAADLVLADDELATVAAAVEEGRRVYDNVRRFLTYGLSGGAAEILVMLVGPFLGLTVPLLPAQILWINLLTHGLPGVAMGAEPAEPEVMRRRPRPPDESILGAGLWQRVGRLAVLIGALSLLVGLWGHASDRPWQTMVFVTLGAAQLGVALGSRARPGSTANPMLLVTVLAALGLQLAGVYLGPLQELLTTEALDLGDLLLCLAAVPLGYLAIRVERRTERAHRDEPSSA